MCPCFSNISYKYSCIFITLGVLSFNFLTFLVLYSSKCSIIYLHFSVLALIVNNSFLVKDVFISGITFGGIDKYIEKGLFEKLEKEEIDPDTELTIIKDLDRTFPSCQLFKDKYGMGQRKLFKVLSSYSKFNKDIGYIQGMGYLVAIFLIYMDEQSSFYLLHSVIKNYELERIYLPGFPDLKKKFYVLLNLEKKFVPKVYDILKRDGVFPSIYASEWFICLFSKDLKPNVLVRIFDTFLFEGFKVIYRFALAFLKMKEKDFIKSKPGIIFTMDVMKKVFEYIDITELFKVAFSFRLSKKHIRKFEQEYENNKNNSNNEFMKQL